MFIKLIKLNIYFPDPKEQVSEKVICMQHFRIQESLELMTTNTQKVKNKTMVLAFITSI